DVARQLVGELGCGLHAEVGIEPRRLDPSGELDVAHPWYRFHVDEVERLRAVEPVEQWERHVDATAVEVAVLPDGHDGYARIAGRCLELQHGTGAQVAGAGECGPDQDLAPLEAGGVLAPFDDREVEVEVATVRGRHADQRSLAVA